MDFRGDHPLINVDQDLTSEQLLDKISSLRKKVSIVCGFYNPDTYVLHQLQLAIQSYSEAYQRRLDQERGDDGLGDLIKVD